MSGFSNPVVNALGDLIRTLMRSANYVAGLAGWQITRDGDAEFNNAIIRGDVVIGGGSPGDPGWLFTQDIPAELQTYYSGVVVAARIGYTNISNLYWYECLLTGGSVRTGFVFNDSVVSETTAHSYSGANHTSLRYGDDSSELVSFIIGPNGGAYNGSDISFQGVDFTVSSTTRFRMVGQLFVDGAYSIPGYVPYAPVRVAANAALNLVVAATLIPGVTTTVAILDVNDVVVCVAFADILALVAPAGNTAIAELFVDGVAQAGQILFRGDGAGDRATAGQSWDMTGLAAGNHTFEIRARATAAAIYQAQSLHCTLNVDPRFRQ